MAKKASEKRDPSSVSNEERLAAMRQLTASKRAVDEAQGSYRALIKRFKAEGIDTKAALDANAASRQDAAIVQAHEVERLRMMALRSIISLDELLEAADHLNVSEKARAADTISDAEDAGYRAGKNGVPIEDCPHPAGSEFAQAWAKWHANGARASASETGKTGAAMNASRERPTRNGAAKLSLVGGNGAAKKTGNGKGAKGAKGKGAKGKAADTAAEAPPVH